MAEALLANVALVFLHRKVDTLGVALEVGREAEDLAADVALQIRTFSQMNPHLMFL